MPSSGKWCLVGLVKTDVSDELQVTANVPSSRIISILKMEIYASETSVLTGSTRRRILENDMLQEFLGLTLYSTFACYMQLWLILISPALCVVYNYMYVLRCPYKCIYIICVVVLNV
jgi:hypothetical protein